MKEKYVTLGRYVTMKEIQDAILMHDLIPDTVELQADLGYDDWSMEDTGRPTICLRGKVKE